MNAELLRTLPVWFVAFLFSTTFHEFAHALVGTKLGDPTAADQVTLDPTPHVRREPFGMVLVPLLSFFMNQGGWMIGWASTPYDPRWASRHPRLKALVSAAGPISNLLLTLIAFGAIRIAIAKGAFAPPSLHEISFDHLVVGASGSATVMSTFASIMFSLNLVLGVFNLIPFPPLDGHGIVALFLPSRLEYKWQRLFDGPAGMLGLVASWVIFPRIFFPIYTAVVPLLYR